MGLDYFGIHLNENSFLVTGRFLLSGSVMVALDDSPPHRVEIETEIVTDEVLGRRRIVVEIAVDEGAGKMMTTKVPEMAGKMAV